MSRASENPSLGTEADAHDGSSSSANTNTATNLTEPSYGSIAASSDIHQAQLQMADTSQNPVLLQVPQCSTSQLPSAALGAPVQDNAREENVSTSASAPILKGKTGNVYGVFNSVNYGPGPMLDTPRVSARTSRGAKSNDSDGSSARSRDQGCPNRLLLSPLTAHQASFFAQRSPHSLGYTQSPENYLHGLGARLPSDDDPALECDKEEAEEEDKEEEVGETAAMLEKIASMEREAAHLRKLQDDLNEPSEVTESLLSTASQACANSAVPTTPLTTQAGTFWSPEIDHDQANLSTPPTARHRSKTAASSSGGDFNWTAKTIPKGFCLEEFMRRDQPEPFAGAYALLEKLNPPTFSMREGVSDLAACIERV